MDNEIEQWTNIFDRELVVSLIYPRYYNNSKKFTQIPCNQILFFPLSSIHVIQIFFYIQYYVMESTYVFTGNFDVQVKKISLC